eukprot:gene49599-32319_t
MDFKHQREIHDIIKKHHPISKICRKEETTASLGEQHLAQAKLVRLTDNYRAEQIPPEVYFGIDGPARRTLHPRPQRRRHHDRVGAAAEDVAAAPRDDDDAAAGGRGERSETVRAA